MPLTITIDKLWVGYRISDSLGNTENYWQTSKKDALRRFKDEKGYRWERGITIVDNTKKEKQNG